MYLSDPIFSGFEYPMSLRHIRTFERRSFDKLEGYPSMSINVYTFEANGTIVSMQISDIYDAELVIDLLYYESRDNSHYIYITDLSRLTFAQLSNH